MIVEHTGLGIRRSKDAVIFTVTSMPRTLKMKKAFYQELCKELETSCGIHASDVMVSMTTTAEADWSFGNGVPQFITGEL